MKKDNDTELAEFYDTHSVIEDGDFDKIEIKFGKIKKISIGIPQKLYTQALGLSVASGTGYQTVLKMAMVIGLKSLANQMQVSNDQRSKEKS